MSKKFTVTVEVISKHTYEIPQEGDSIMEAFDLAREKMSRLTKNSTDKTRHWFVTKIIPKE